MKLTREQVNAIIAKGMGYAKHSRNTALWTLAEEVDKVCHTVVDLPEFISWEGFGRIMEYAEDNGLIGMFYKVPKPNAHDWPKVAALMLASHFAGEQVEMEGGCR